MKRLVSKLVAWFTGKSEESVSKPKSCLQKRIRNTNNLRSIYDNGFRYVTEKESEDLHDLKERYTEWVANVREVDRVRKLAGIAV